MKASTAVLILLTLSLPGWAGQDFQCMQACLGQGYDRGYCLGVCSTASAREGLLDQPGLPGNPFFEQIQPRTPRQSLPKVADPNCMKDCQRKGYGFAFCYHKVCSYAPLGE